MAIVEPNGDGTFSERLVEDEVEVGVVIEVNGQEESGFGDGEAGDIGAVVAVEVGGGPGGLGQVSQSRGGGEDEKKERLHLNRF